MLLWGVEARELCTLQLICRFPSYDNWTKVSYRQPDLLLTNAMAVIESSGHVPQLPPRLHLADPRRAATVGAPGTPSAVYMPDCRLSMPEKPVAPPLPAPSAKTSRPTAGNGRRHRKKEFQMQPSRARCEVGLACVRSNTATYMHLYFARNRQLRIEQNTEEIHSKRAT